MHWQIALEDAKAFSFCWSNLDVAVLLQCCLTFLCSKGRAMQPGHVSYSAAQPDSYKWSKRPAKRRRKGTVTAQLQVELWSWSSETF